MTLEKNTFSKKKKREKRCGLKSTLQSTGTFVYMLYVYKFVITKINDAIHIFFLYLHVLVHIGIRSAILAKVLCAEIIELIRYFCDHE